MLREFSLLHLDKLLQRLHLLFVVTNLAVSLFDSALKCSNFGEKLFFSPFTSGAHVLFFLLDLSQKLVNLGLKVRADCFPLLILLSSQNLHVLRVVSFKSSDTAGEGVFHTHLLLGVPCLQIGHILGVLFFKSSDLSVELTDLIACVCRQTLDLVFEALNLPL